MDIFRTSCFFANYFWNSEAVAQMRRSYGDRGDLCAVLGGGDGSVRLSGAK
jgi:hypothetical protein